MSRRAEAVIDPHPVLDKLYADLSQSFSAQIMLWRCERDDLSGRYGGELDTALLMPGWHNVWTMPIQNRVDMLNSGINTEIGVRVLGRRQADVVRVSDDIAAVLREVPGVAGVSVEQIRGKGYLEIRPDREQAARRGVSIGDLNDLIETAIGGTVVTTTVEGRERHAVRVRYLRDWSRDEESIRRLPVPVREVVGTNSELALAAGRRLRRRGLGRSSDPVLPFLPASGDDGSPRRSGDGANHRRSRDDQEPERAGAGNHVLVNVRRPQPSLTCSNRPGVPSPPKLRIASKGPISRMDRANSSTPWKRAAR